MGAQTTKADHGEGISFMLGADKVHALILTPDMLADRNAILDAILTLSTLQSTYQLMYLAAPRLFGASIDASLFRSRGIGLLLYDERRIEEVVPAQAMHTSQAVQPTQFDQTVVATELATLRTMYLQMERTISQLRNDLTSIRNPQPTDERTPIVPVPTRLITSQADFSQGVMQGGQLPSYFTNNPWLEVLSKRGNGEREPIAG
jgi:hypothetical protein